MNALNYHHLQYFWTVAREGGVAAAAAKLKVAQPTVSAQVHALENSVGDKLFERRGRRLVLTEAGRLAFGYADEIFRLGGELVEALAGRPTGKPLKLSVGLTDVVPKLVAHRLLVPTQSLEQPIHLLCIEDKPERLFEALARHELDLVISDASIPVGSPIRAYSHLLGESTLTFFATRPLAKRYTKGFPRSLDGAPMLMPTSSAAVRRALDDWFERQGIQVRIVAELEDSALLKVFGQEGAGLFPAPTVFADEIKKQHGVYPLGEVPEVRERYFAISAERRLKHPAVVAISESARAAFAPDGPSV